MQHQRVALLTIGQPRSAAHPAVAASFDLLRSSLLRDGHSVSHFMWLTPPHTPLRSDDAGWLRALEVYKPTVLRFANDTLPCRPACRIRCDTHGHDSAIEWLRQFYAVHRAYQFAKAYSTFDWFIRLRPDLLHLEPLQPLSSFSPEAAYVPRGVMTRAPADQRNNDHIFVCPSGELCDRYFDTVARTYGRCEEGFRIRWPWQRLFSSAYTNGTLLLFDHAYTLARSEVSWGRPAGPECMRLDCSKDPHATGCVAPHLVGFVTRCEENARAWQHAGWMWLERK